MIKKYLKKLRSELLEEKMKLESELKQTRIKADRNGKFLEKLKEEEEQNYDLFSPRKKNMKLRESIHEFEQEQGVLTQRSGSIDEDLHHLNMRLTELDSILKIVKENEKEEKNSYLELHDYLDKNIKRLLNKAELCVKLLPADPVRCKMELSFIVRALQEVQEIVSDCDDSRKTASKKGGVG